MKHILLTLALMALPGLAAANCFADYKAKQDRPLRLHYGVMQVGACNAQAAGAEVRSRLAAHGWTLLTIVSVFDEGGLAARRDDAGQYFLRF